MTNVRRQSWQTWIWRNLEPMLFVVVWFLFRLQLGQVSGGRRRVRPSRITSSTRGTGRFFPFGFVDDERPMAVPADVDFSQERLHGFDGVLRMTVRTGAGRLAHGMTPGDSRSITALVSP
jgi:hypothetical protein